VTLVFGFDRDWTVDVNPHPDREAVPLEWVRHIAHETAHSVYAIGNQILAEEAAIPGVVDIVGRHADDWADWLGGKQPDGYYERFPTRHERLALIADLHPDADGYIVVDDIDLSTVDGWEHYHAWEFVPAVRRGEIDPALPWAREPVADGGCPASAGIMPADGEHLASFLDEHADAPAFKLTYEDETGSDRTQLLANVSIRQRTIDRPAAAPTIACVPLQADADSFRLRVDAIERLAVIASSLAARHVDADTPAERATLFRLLAEVHPDEIDVSRLLTLLDRDETGARQDALHALRQVAETRPEACTPAIPVLQSLLDSDDLASPAPALATLRAIGEHDAAAIAPLTDDLRTYLHATDETSQREATRCIAEVADADPTDAVEAVPGLATVLTDDVTGQSHAVYALSCLSREFPEALRPVTDELADVVMDPSRTDAERLNATAALGRFVSEHPSAGVDFVDDLVELLDADHHKLRNNVMALLSDVAKLHTDALAPHMETITPLLTVEDTYTRINASAAVSRVAEDFPEVVSPAVPTLRALLDDEDAIVRENACWGLGYLEDETAKPDLERISRTDDSDDVRTRAMWAIAQIERGQGI